MDDVEPCGFVGYIGDEKRQEFGARSELRVLFREFRLWFDGQSGPTELRLQIESFAGASIVVGPDVDEETVATILEEVANHPFFFALGEVIRTITLTQRLQLSGALDGILGSSGSSPDITLPHPKRRDPYQKRDTQRTQANRETPSR